jgi:hypothetical protein
MAGTAYFVMLPTAAANLLPQEGRRLPDATALLDEWVCCLDPIAALRETAQAETIELPDWGVSTIVAASPTAIRTAREGAADNAVIAALRRSPQHARFVSGDGLVGRALPVIRGLAVLAALRLQVGPVAHELRLARQRARADASERRSVSEASELRPTLSPLPPPGEPLDAD